MKILGLIPARGGSKGVPRKNIRSLGGRPLLDWTIKAALMVTELDRIVVSTEDSEIAEIAVASGGEVPFLRPDHLATDEAKSIDVVQHVLRGLASEGNTFDAVCLLQPTTPFRSPELIRKALKKFASGRYSGLVSVKEVPSHFHPNWTFITDENDFLEPAQGPGSVISRRQDLPRAYIRDGAIYITKTETIESGSFFGDRLGYLANDDDFKVNIDTMKDWKEAERIAKFIQNN